MYPEPVKLTGDGMILAVNDGELEGDVSTTVELEAYAGSGDLELRLEVKGGPPRSCS